MSEAFRGLTVLDFTRYLSGPFATYQLSLLGANVIKIESPQGDATRSVSKDKTLSHAGMSPTFFALNGNKKSIVVDLRKPEGTELVKRLAAQADVVCENFRPGVMKQLGLDYETLRDINPSLIYCSISGFGHTGPEKYASAFDGKIQAMSGIMAMTGDPATGPMRTGFAACDLIAGMTAAFAISSALYERTSSGQGTFIDVSMLDAALSFLGSQVCETTMTGEKHTQMGNLSVSRKVTENLFKAGRGDIVLAVLNEKQFRALMCALGREDALNDPRFADWFSRTEHEPALREIIETAMATETPEYWERRLTEADVPCAVVRRVDEIIECPQLRHREVLQEVETFAGRYQMAGAGFQWGIGPLKIEQAAPHLGAHTRDVLRKTGFNEQAIDALLENGVVVHGDVPDAQALERS